MTIRPYRHSDLEWMLALAEEYREGEDLRMVKERGKLFGWVVEPLCALVIHPDPHGLVLSGITGKPGMRDFLRLCRHAKEALTKLPGLVLHSHMEPDTWQDKLYRKMGFVRENGALWWRA